MRSTQTITKNVSKSNVRNINIHTGDDRLYILPYVRFDNKENYLPTELKAKLNDMELYVIKNLIQPEPKNTIIHVPENAIVFIIRDDNNIDLGLPRRDFNYAPAFKKTRTL